jgi:hypothetical protein
MIMLAVFWKEPILALRSMVWLGLLLPGYGHAQQIPIKSYTTADGLGHNRVERTIAFASYTQTVPGDSG